jgi:RNA polymerase sigma-70 factor (ECF subfamily)
VDPSDVVQETLTEAVRDLPDYLRDRPLPFYPWLRQLAVRHLTRAAEHHLQAQQRSVTREERVGLGLSNESVIQLAERLAADGTSPSAQAARTETQALVRAALARLPVVDREVLVLRFIEQLSTSETAVILGITPEAVGMRRLRALRQLSGELGEPQS